MPPPGASVPAFAATAEAASSPPHANIQGKTRRQRMMERVLGICRGCDTFCSESPRPILIFFAAEKNGPPAVVVAATMSASDSNFVAAKKNGFACSGRGDYDLPRPILIFVAAKKNGFACYGRSSNEVPRPILISSPQRRMVSPATP